MSSSNVEALLQAWLDAKHAETEAQKHRLEIETEILQAFEIRPEGQITHKIADYSLTLLQPVAVKADMDVWKQVMESCPEAMRPFKVKIEPDVSKVKHLKNNEPEIWRKIARAFETSYGKIGVKVVRNG